MAKQENKKTESSSIQAVLWVTAGVLLFALLFAREVYPELLWLTILVGIPLLINLGVLVRENQKALRSRSAAYGLNSVVTVILIVGIVGVLNFLGARYPVKWDLTKNKLHTLSDQSVKAIQSLQKPLKVTFYGKLQQKEQFKPLLDNYKSLNPKWEIEYIDPDRQPTLARQNNIKKYGTLQMELSGRDTKIEDLTEEKITNALIKLLKEKSQVFCVTAGHGEKPFTGEDADSYSTIKKSLSDQSYEVKEINLVAEQKVPDSCDAIGIVGPTKAFFEPEVKMIQEYLDKGGRAIVALDLNIKGGEYASELFPVLEEWHIQPLKALVVDPLSRMLGVDASVAILASFSKDSPITKDFQGNCAFPFMRPLEISAGAPPSMNIHWLAQSTPKSWAVMDLKDLAKGEVQFKEGQDRLGPLNAALVVDGKKKDSTATRNTRIVTFGSSQFATNHFARFAGNLDLFVNSVSWLMEDESLISIHDKEEGPGKVELSQKAGTFIFLLTVLAMPLIIASTGVGIWFFRRKL